MQTMSCFMKFTQNKIQHNFFEPTNKTKNMVKKMDVDRLTP
jgi:hypothetical protein